MFSGIVAWPKVLSPQLVIVPSRVIAILCWSPAAIVMALGSIDGGWNWLFELVPHSSIVPSVFKAREWEFRLEIDNTFFKLGRTFVRPGFVPQAITSPSSRR